MLLIFHHHHRICAFTVEIIDLARDSGAVGASTLREG